MEEKFEKYLPFKDRTYCIRGYIGEVDDYEENRGYINRETGQIYICSKDKSPAHLDVPIIFVKNGDIKFKDVSNSKTYEYFVEKNLYELSYQKIHDTTNGDEVLYNEEALADMNAASAVFVPIINDEDDSLKKIIKQTIISKQVDINRLKHKMPEKYALTNMKSALIGKTKMSIANFNLWCELLGVTYTIIISDNGTDPIDPLNEDVVFSSDTNRLETITRSSKKAGKK